MTYVRIRLTNKCYAVLGLAAFSVLRAWCADDASKTWRETAIVPIGTSFATPDALAEAIKTGDKIKVTAPHIGDLDIKKFLIDGTTTPQLEEYVVETSDIRVLDSFLAASLGYLSASAGFNSTTIVVVEQWRKFIPVSITIDDNSYKNATVIRIDKKGKNVGTVAKRKDRNQISAQLGYSMSIVTRIDATGANVNLGTLIKSFSAGFQFERFSATSNTEVIGLSSSDITEALPSSIDFLEAQAEAAGDQTDPAQIGRARYQAMVRKMAEKFKGMRTQVWPSHFHRPMLIGLDLDGVERLTGLFYDSYSVGKR